MAPAGTASSSLPRTSVFAISSSAFTSARTSSSALPMPMMSCMWVGSSLVIASSSHLLVTMGVPLLPSLPSLPLLPSLPFLEMFSSRYSSTARRAIPCAKGGTRRMRCSASGAHGRPAWPSSSIQGMSSGRMPMVPVRSRLQGASRTRFSACEPSSVLSIRWAPCREMTSSDGLISSAHCMMTWNGLPIRICFVSGMPGNSFAISSARRMLAWQSLSRPLSMMLLCSSSCSSNLNTFEACTDSTSLMLLKTTWWYSTSKALHTYSDPPNSCASSSAARIAL